MWDFCIPEPFRAKGHDRMISFNYFILKILFRSKAKYYFV